MLAHLRPHRSLLRAATRPCPHRQPGSLRPAPEDHGIELRHALSSSPRSQVLLRLTPGKLVSDATRWQWSSTDARGCS